MWSWRDSLVRSSVLHPSQAGSSRTRILGLDGASRTPPRTRAELSLLVVNVVGGRAGADRGREGYRPQAATARGPAPVGVASPECTGASPPCALPGGRRALC